MKITLILTVIIAIFWISPVNSDIQYDCGESAIVSTLAIRLKNNGYNQTQSEVQVLEDAREPEKAKIIISKVFEANTMSYKDMSYDQTYNITYKLCLAGIGP